MLIVDEEKQKEFDKWATIERTRDLTQQAVTLETSGARAVDDKRTSVANAQRQEGTRMSASVFSAKLRSINADLTLEPHPLRHLAANADKACIYLLLPNGKKEFILVCEGDFMPEWSVMETKQVRKPDAKIEGMWKTVTIPGREVKRGWRTVLIRLLQKGLVSLTDVERVFGPGDRETWKVLTGKGAGMLLI